MSVEELSKLLPKELIDAAYVINPKMGDYAWQADDFKKVLAHFVKIKRMVAGGEIWSIKGDDVDLTGSVWYWEADKVDQSKSPEKWYQAAISEVEKYQALGDDIYFDVVLYPPNEHSPKFK
jgi:formylmethanofuran dehydrogenase subunit A